jgi:signal transduction histidine kinase
MTQRGRWLAPSRWPGPPVLRTNTKPAGEGTGIGLSISHDIIVKQHGGSIEVDTQLGEFTEIKITLPRSGVFPTEPTKHA